MRFLFGSVKLERFQNIPLMLVSTVWSTEGRLSQRGQRSDSGPELCGCHGLLGAHGGHEVLFTEELQRELD